jgi:glycogen synthase
LSALEAALAGCALVLGDIPSLREVWGEAAVYVAPDDPAGLTCALRQLIAQPSRLAQLAQKATRRARQYTPELMAERYLTAYVQAMTRHSTQRAEEPGEPLGELIGRFGQAERAKESDSSCVELPREVIACA